MGPYIESLRTWLLERGYTPGSIKQILTLAGRLGRWMEGSDVKFSQLDSVAVESFLDALRGRSVRRVLGPRLQPLLNYLDSEGALAFRPVPDSPIERLVVEYRTWLVVDRGLAAPTVLRYENLARRFLGQQPTADGSMLAAADVVGFLLRESERVSVGAVKGRVAELRSLLRFLRLKGFTPTALASAVPPAAGWHDTGIPVGIAADEVQRLLDGCDRALSRSPYRAFDAGLRPGPFPDRAASLLPGLLAATRTGLAPAGDDELTTKISYTNSPPGLLDARKTEANGLRSHHPDVRAGTIFPDRDAVIVRSAPSWRNNTTNGPKVATTSPSTCSPAPAPHRPPASRRPLTRERDVGAARLPRRERTARRLRERWPSAISPAPGFWCAATLPDDEGTPRPIPG